MIEVKNLILTHKKQINRLQIPELKFNSPGITALVGQNGAGKSSLLHILAGYEKASIGQAFFNKKDTFLNFEQIKMNVHLLSWSIELFKGQSALSHIKLVKSLSKTWDKNLEQELMKDLAIPFEKKVGHLSRGEQARLRILLSLSQSPKVILLDEVTNDLDIDSRRSIFKKLDSYSFDTGAQVIVATNMIDDIERYASDIILLKQGKILLQGRLDTLKEQYKLTLEDIIRMFEKREDL